MTMTDQPQAIFFDLDGTLLDPSDATLEADWRASCEAYGDGTFDVDRLLPHLHGVRIGFWKDAERSRRGRADLMWARGAVVRDAFAKIDLTDNNLAARIASDYFERRDAAITLFPSAVETVERVRAMGIRTALITNGGAVGQRGKVERFALAPYFDCIVIEGEFGVGKPDERVFHHALASVGCTAESAWMVGDNLEADIATPHRLGMHTIWLDADARGLPASAAARPHRIVRSIAELMPPRLG